MKGRSDGHPAGLARPAGRLPTIGVRPARLPPRHASPTRRALALQERAARRGSRPASSGDAAAARAPARLHARAAARSRATCRWARTCAAPRASTSCDDAARRQADLPRAGPAGRLSDHARRRRARLRAHDGAARSSPRSPRRASRRARATAEGRDYTGVWVEDRKIASIGVHVSRGVSTHGFAVNVDNDLAPFTGSSPAGCRRCG